MLRFHAVEREEDVEGHRSLQMEGPFILKFMSPFAVSRLAPYFIKLASK